jgi:putative DNA primase/helicase
LCAVQLSASNITTASVYRVIQQCTPLTLLLDEADTYMDGNEELRGVLNSGNQRHKAYVLRTNRDTGKVERFPTWCPKAISRIGKLPDTIKDRSIEIRMTRKKKDEKVSPLRQTSLQEIETLRRKIHRWVNDHREAIRSAKPQLPEYLYNRELDNWIPLIAIAQEIGCKENLLKAIASLSRTDSDEESINIVLLLGLRALFKEEIMADRVGLSFEKILKEESVQNHHIATEDILRELNNDKEAPWADWRHGKEGEGLSARKLAELLNPYGIKSNRPSTVKGREIGRGYTFKDLQPTFERYLREGKE